MEVRETALVQENRFFVPKEDQPPRASVSKEERASAAEGPPPSPDRVGATLGPADVHEMAEHISEIINEAMRALNFSLNFEPDFKSGEVTIRVMDEEGKLVRQIPLSEFYSLRDKLSSGALEGGILTHQVVP